MTMDQFFDAVSLQMQADDGEEMRKARSDNPSRVTEPPPGRPRFHTDPEDASLALFAPAMTMDQILEDVSIQMQTEIAAEIAKKADTEEPAHITKPSMRRPRANTDPLDAAHRHSEGRRQQARSRGRSFTEKQEKKEEEDAAMPPALVDLQRAWSLEANRGTSSVGSHS